MIGLICGGMWNGNASCRFVGSTAGTYSIWLQRWFGTRTLSIAISPPPFSSRSHVSPILKNLCFSDDVQENDREKWVLLEGQVPWRCLKKHALNRTNFSSSRLFGKKPISANDGEMDGRDGVYPSSEDTFLLMDALKLEEPLLRDTAEPGGLCLEIGCGSGEITAMLASTLSTSVCFSTDVNHLATSKTRQVAEEENLDNTEVIIADMFTAFRPETIFDVVVFNPPYVPTDPDELDRALTTRDIAASWAGGEDGREVINVFLTKLVPFLSEFSLVYLVLLEANSPSQISIYAKELGLTSTTVMKRTAGIETLYILRFRKDC